MSKKIFVAAVAALALGATVHAQTNFQTFYDFGRKHFTTTLEGFHQDNWGNTFFFIDYAPQKITGTPSDQIELF